MAIQFVHNKHVFSEQYDATVEDVYKVTSAVDGQQVYVNLLDTSGQEEFFSMRDVQIRDNEGFLLVYAINDRNGFEDLKKLVVQIRALKGSEVFPCVLVENKSDLEAERVVSQQEGRLLAGELRAPFHSSSAKLGRNVRQSFETLLRRCDELVVPDLAGYLIKQGHGSSTFGRRNWKRRWFDIHARKVFYRKEPDAPLVLGQFNISDIRSVTANDDIPANFEFSIELPGRVYQIRAESGEDREKWCTVLRRLAHLS